MGLPWLSAYAAEVASFTFEFGVLKPKLIPPLPLVKAAVEYWGWLNILKKSSWNCILTRSVSLKFFRKEKSTSLLPGPVQMPTPALPSCPTCNPFTVKALGLNHCRPSPVLLDRQDWPGTRFGR